MSAVLEATTRRTDWFNVTMLNDDGTTFDVRIPARNAHRARLLAEGIYEDARAITAEIES